ncbi:MAG: hypothetical protein J4F39_10445 [Candidatus Latescibacteria bacterium]|nr:hypothetical protein [Candidatus Latescibacterota bacterium]
MDYLFERTPVIFLVDEHNRIIQCHHPVYKREQFTALFLEELIFSRLPALNVNPTGFADSPLRQLQDLSLLEVIEGRIPYDDPF